MRRVRQPGDPDPRSILVVLPTWVGDFVMATPVLRAIRRRFAQSHVTFLAEPNLRDLIRGGDWMNECVEWPPSRGRQPARMLFSKEYRDLAWDLRRRRFDWAILLPNSFRSALMARVAGARRRIGYDRDGRGFLLTDRLPVKNRRKTGVNRRELGRARGAASDRTEHGQTSLPMPPDGLLSHEREFARAPDRSGFHCARGSGEGVNDGVTGESLTWGRGAPVRVGANLPVPPGRFIPMPLVEYYADLAEAIGCERPGDRLELFTTPDCEKSVQERLSSLGIADRHPLVVISPGAKYGAAKCWMPERFAAVADRLVETEGAAVIVTCGPGEEPIARQIGAAMRRETFVFAAPRLSLGEMKSLVGRSDLLICNDAGPRHFAKAFDVPVATVFGATHPEWTATSYEAERIVRIHVDCGPCQQRVCPLKHLKCMDGVSVDMVVAACRELLESRVRQAVT
jgi:ADP-heptose:LPS heptosyltransferase